MPRAVTVEQRRASLRVAAACITRTTSGVATHRVRRMAWCLTTVRSSYSACSTAPTDGRRMRTMAER